MSDMDVNDLRSEVVEDGKDRLCSSTQNGQCLVTSTNSVNTTDDNCYVDSCQATTPLLSDRYRGNSEDGDEELSSDSATDAATFLKRAVDADETSLRIALQVFFPYLIAGLGMVGAGAVLEIVKVCL